jgi:hypothetical protein
VRRTLLRGEGTSVCIKRDIVAVRETENRTML